MRNTAGALGVTGQRACRHSATLEDEWLRLSGEIEAMENTAAPA